MARFLSRRNGHAGVVPVMDGWFLAAPVGPASDDELVRGGEEPVDCSCGHLYSLCRPGRPAWSRPSWTVVNDVLPLLAEELIFAVGTEQEGEGLEVVSQLAYAGGG